MAFDIARVKAAWEGFETPLSRGRYPVEFDPIRRHCHMVEDTNPLFLEQGVCPPVMVDYFASRGAWPPGEHVGGPEGDQAGSAGRLDQD